MAYTPHGKGYFIWKIRYCEDGDLDAIVQLSLSSGLTHIVPKVADGISSYNIHPDTGEDLAKKLTVKMKAHGVQVWGWQYIYGYDPAREADKAIERVNGLGLDGFIVDAESQYKGAHMSDEATLYINRLRAGVDVPIALSSYRFPSYHPEFRWQEFMSVVDFAMPQVYWEQSYNPAEQLSKCLAEYKKFGKPVVPTGSAYKRGDWSSTPENVTEFLFEAENQELTGANFWEWAHTRKYLLPTWDAIAEYKWEGETPPPPPPNGGSDMIDQVIEDAKKVKAAEVGDVIVLNVHYYEGAPPSNGGNGGNGGNGDNGDNGDNGGELPDHVITMYAVPAQQDKDFILAYYDTGETNDEGNPKAEAFEPKVKVPKGEALLIDNRNVQFDGGRYRRWYDHFRDEKQMWFQLEDLDKSKPD